MARGLVWENITPKLMVYYSHPNEIKKWKWRRGKKTYKIKIRIDAVLTVTERGVDGFAPDVLTLTGEVSLGFPNFIPR